MTAQPLKGQLFRWTVEKSTRSFRVFVVEPSLFIPEQHAAIFNAALTTLLRPETCPEDLYRQDKNMPVSEPFDLITFPEAFLSTEDLIRTLDQVAEFGSMGCVHVGLRSSNNPTSHLISADEFRTTIAQLSRLTNIVPDDLASVNSWLGRQNDGGQFNVACLFVVDIRSRLRICLHPKMVRSGFEVGVVSDSYMTEANLVSLVTLLPEPRKFLTVTIHPIICSDTLQLDVDDPGRRPLDCLNDERADVFSDLLPDHIDVVSVVACTPQQVGYDENGMQFRKWHEEFRATFERIGKGGLWHRHYHAAFVLSNFQETGPSHDPESPRTFGGLSGGFLPLPMPADELPSYVQLSAYGKKKRQVENRWSDPLAPPTEDFSSRGYIAHLAPKVIPGIAARMLGFVITAFPRDAPHWKSGGTLAKFQLRTGRFNGDGSVTFVKGDL